MTSKKIPYLIQNKNIILVIDGKSHTISKDTHIAYGKIAAALKAEDWDALRKCVDPAVAIVNFGKGYIKIDNGNVFWKGQPFHNALATRMVEMYKEGFPIDPMIALMENLMQNPSKRSVDQLYGFLEKNNLPITEDGHFLAFKRVNANYTDCHTSTMDNSIGCVVEMDRNLVDDNPDSLCSTGLHFCSESYLGSFGSASQPVMIVKINPADVVSIPTDYNGAKGRCRKFEVVAQVSGDPKDAFAYIVDKTYAPAPVKNNPQPVWPTPASALVNNNPQPVWPTPASALVNNNPQAAWPFPVDNSCKGSACDKLYDVVRVYGWSVEHVNVDLATARALVAKNIAQKKAMLRIVEHGTNNGVV